MLTHEQVGFTINLLSRDLGFLNQGLGEAFEDS